MYDVLALHATLVVSVCTDNTQPTESRMRLIIALALFVLSASALSAQTAEVDATDGTKTLGKLPCANLQSAQVALCAYEALKQGQPDVTVRVLLPGGEIRYIYFE